MSTIGLILTFFIAAVIYIFDKILFKFLDEFDFNHLEEK